MNVFAMRSMEYLNVNFFLLKTKMNNSTHIKFMAKQYSKEKLQSNSKGYCDGMKRSL